MAESSTENNTGLTPDEAARLSRERENGSNSSWRSPDARGSSTIESLRSTENETRPWEVGFKIFTKYSREDIVPEEEKYYGIDRHLDIMWDRGTALSLGLDDLKKRGIISFSNNNEIVAKEDGYELGRRTLTKEIPRRIVRDKDDNVLQTESELVEVEVPYFGSDEERRSLSEKFLTSYDLLQILKLQTEKHRFYKKNIENITGLAEEHYLGEHITMRALKAMFNMPGTIDTPKETITGVKYKVDKEGGSIGHTMFMLYELVGNCEKKADFLALRDTPGYFKYLFPESQRGRAGISEKEKFFIGNPYEWEDEDKHEPNTYKKETEDGKRGFLTRHGNIFARFDEKQYQDIRNVVRTFLGGGKRNFLDSNIEYNLEDFRENQDVYVQESFFLNEFKYFGEASDVGIEEYVFDLKKEKLKPIHDQNLELIEWAERMESAGVLEKKIVISEMGGDVSDDYIKLVPGAFMRVYFEKGRDAGALKVIFKLDVRLHTTLTRGISMNVKFGDREVKRSIKELMWGSFEKAEEAMFIGDMPLLQAGRRGLQRIGLTTFMGGRGGDSPGVFHILQKTNLNLESLTDENWWLDFHKKIQLSAGNSAVVTRGEWRKYEGDAGKLAVARMQKEAVVKILTSLVKNLESYTQHATTNTNKNIKTGALTLSRVELINHAIRRFNQRTGLEVPIVSTPPGETPDSTKDIFKK